MTKGVRVLMVALIILIGILATSTGFFFAENTTLKGKIKSNNESVPAIAETDSSSLDEPLDSSLVETKKEETPVVKPAETATKPTTTTTTTTKPATTTTTKTATSTSTYTVKSGDTMSSIASGLGVSWLDLAKANGLDEKTADKIKIGQVLTVPKD